MLARTLERPIRALQAGAVRIGEGNLTDRIEVKTGDELEVLGDQFNRMAVQLQESYAGLERKVDARTRELQEALEQQTATAEILGVISGSPTDSQPVMDAVAQSAARLCDAVDAQIFRIEGDFLRSVAIHGAIPQCPRQRHRPGLRERTRRARATHGARQRPRRGGGSTSSRTPGADSKPPGRGRCWPPRCSGKACRSGSSPIRRLEVRPFSDKQIALLETFADQAVIAIENVRLFQELQARTQDLSQSLEETGALSEVIRAVSSSLDLREILDTVARRAVALSDADGCGIFELRPGRHAFDVVVSQGLSAEFVDAVLHLSVGVDHGTISQAAETGEPVQIPDVEDAHGYPLPDALPAAKGSARC